MNKHNMKTIVMIGMFLFGGLAGSMFAQGIQFHKGTFEAAQKQARQEKKLIFIDFHTVWCGPCKVLAKNVFPQPEVGDYFNKSFVNCKLDAEREGRELAKKYGVVSYPTLLFLNPEGEVINKVIGSVSAEKLIDIGKQAVATIDDPENMDNLKKRYAAGEDDEAFLKLYIEKMTQFRENPYEAIEKYLKVQHEMKENSSKMMEFMIKNSKNLIVGGEAERILNANYDEFMDIATRKEENAIKALRHRIIKNTQDLAIYQQDEVMYKLFLDRWEKMFGQASNYKEEYTKNYLELLLIQKNSEEYRKVATAYLDGMVNAHSAEEIQKMDKEHYEAYCKEHPGGNIIEEALKERHRSYTAKKQVHEIISIGSELTKIAGKKDFKKLNQWLNHAKLLQPEDVNVVSFEANLLYRQGKKKEGIELKNKALRMVKVNSRYYPPLKEELDEMEEGTF